MGTKDTPRDTPRAALSRPQKSARPIKTGFTFRIDGGIGDTVFFASDANEDVEGIEAGPGSLEPKPFGDLGGLMMGYSFCVTARQGPQRLDRFDCSDGCD